MSYNMEPLYVNTECEYELDMGKFPGWEDPVKRYQPKLLIHQSVSCLCNCIQNVDDLTDVKPEKFFHQTEFEELTEYLISDTKELNFDWEAQLSPISIPTETPQPTDSTDSVSEENHLTCSKKRKFSCLEDYAECEENLCKKIHIDNEDILDFLNVYIDNNLKDISNVHNKSDLCRGS